MTKDERNFIIFLPLILIVAFFVPIIFFQWDWLLSLWFILGPYVIYFLWATGTLSIPSVLIFVAMKMANKGKLTKKRKWVFASTSAALFIVLACYSVLTFVLPFLIDYPASCFSTGPSNLICWAGFPIPQGIFFASAFGISFLSALSLPFFILLLLEGINSLYRRKIERVESTSVKDARF